MWMDLHQGTVNSQVVIEPVHDNGVTNICHDANDNA